MGKERRAQLMRKEREGKRGTFTTRKRGGLMEQSACWREGPVSRNGVKIMDLCPGEQGGNGRSDRKSGLSKG